MRAKATRIGSWGFCPLSIDSRKQSSHSLRGSADCAIVDFSLSIIGRSQPASIIRSGAWQVCSLIKQHLSYRILPWSGGRSRAPPRNLRPDSIGVRALEIQMVSRFWPQVTEQASTINRQPPSQKTIACRTSVQHKQPSQKIVLWDSTFSPYHTRPSTSVVRNVCTCTIASDRALGSTQVSDLRDLIK